MAHVIVGEAASGADEAHFVLGRTLADDGAGLTSSHAKAVDCVELHTDEVSRGSEGVAEGAEEACAGPVREDEA